MLRLRRICLGLAGVAALAVVIGVCFQFTAMWQVAAVCLAGLLAIGFGGIPALRSFQYTLWIMTAVTAAMIYPQAFQTWGSFKLRDPWMILLVIQGVMFGMGTQMSIHDLRGVGRQPRGVLVGIFCHFSVMPLVGFGLTKLFHFPPEIAAGVILIGSCSSGLASNVMAYIARANIALSVTVTAITTMLAPVMTPTLMKLLAGTLVDVKFVKMMLEIIQQVIVPISAALLHDYLKQASMRGRRVVYGLTGFAVVWLVLLPCGLWSFVLGHCSVNIQTAASIFGFVMGAIVVGVGYHQWTRHFAGLDARMPLLSMAGIVYFTLVTTAAGRNNLLVVGWLLVVAAIIHNSAGYFFGYWLSRAARLDVDSARSVAFEVGLQNGGMASGLAAAMGKLATVGLAPAIFSPWMNISGSLLANFWRRRPTHKAAAPLD